jgi:hypothetical protein
MGPGLKDSTDATPTSQRPYFTAAANVKMKAAATASSAATKQILRSLRFQLAMSDPPQAARAYAPTGNDASENVSQL